jgi:hypothetical protein
VTCVPIAISAAIVSSGWPAYIAAAAFVGFAAIGAWPARPFAAVAMLMFTLVLTTASFRIFIAKPRSYLITGAIEETAIVIIMARRARTISAPVLVATAIAIILARATIITTFISHDILLVGCWI